MTEKVNPQGTVSVESKGETYTLEMNFGVLGDLEEEFGDQFNDMINGKQNPSIKFILRVVTLCLTEGDPDIGNDLAYSVARRVTSQDLFTRLMRAAFPDAEVGEKKGNPKGPKRAA